MLQIDHDIEADRLASYIIITLKYGKDINVYILSHLLSAPDNKIIRNNTQVMNHVADTLYQIIFSGNERRTNSFDSIARYLIRISGFNQKS